MHQITEQLKLARIVPVVVLQDAADAKPLAKALCDGGLPCAEITFRTESAAEAIKIMTQEFPQMLVGAGTVLTPVHADVRPGLNPTMVKHCIKRKYPVFPGVNNPTGIETALSMGLTMLKFFPAEASGGLAMIKALSAPYPQIRFMPTGGINLENVYTYLACDRVFACGGSWMVKEDLIKTGNFEEIQRLAEEAVRTVRA